MDTTWINISAGVITVITGVITIINAFKHKKTAESVSSLQSSNRGNVTSPTSVTYRKVTAAPIPVVAGVQEFSGDDKGYQEWIESHPKGFVINTYRGISDQYMCLHKASCGHISNFSSRNSGAFTEGDFMKACAIDLDRLRDWVKAHGRADGSFTGNCHCIHSLKA